MYEAFLHGRSSVYRGFRAPQRPELRVWQCAPSSVLCDQEGRVSADRESSATVCGQPWNPLGRAPEAQAYATARATRPERTLSSTSPPLDHSRLTAAGPISPDA